MKEGHLDLCREATRVGGKQQDAVAHEDRLFNAPLPASNRRPMTSGKAIKSHRLGIRLRAVRLALRIALSGTGVPCECRRTRSTRQRNSQVEILGPLSHNCKIN